MRRQEGSAVDFEAAVIGAGPGGLVSALYLRRALRSTILASVGTPRASWIPKTHNLLGYRGGISGVELLRRLHAQLDDFGLERIVGDCRVDRYRSGFRVTCGHESFTAKKVVLATGMTDLQPAVKHLPRLRRCGLLRYCPVCDAYEYRDRRVLVLARDAHGVRSAEYLSHFTPRVTLLGPASLRRFTRLPVLIGELVSIDESAKGGEGAVAYRASANSVLNKIVCDAVYVALGASVNDAAFAHLSRIKRGERGGILTSHHLETAVPGLFAVGDCVEGLAQIAVAAGQAAIAATRIHNDLRGRR